jgi:ribosomal protein L11 methyltransferase
MSIPRLRELTVDAPADREEAVVAAVYRMGVQGVEVRDASTANVPAGRVVVVAWLPPSPVASRAIRGLRRRLGADVRCTWRDVVITWEAEPAATPIGARFVVVAPRTDPALSDPARLPLVLDAHLAFGDGLHPTTVLCVEALERRYAPVGPASVLDVGTGTGILAIVAARLGATRVVAQDIDPLALWATRRHVADNAAAVDVVDTLPDARFDLVIANLYFAPLLALIPALAARVATGGELVVSGFNVEARDRVVTACVAVGLIVREAEERDGWGLLAAVPG